MTDRATRRAHAQRVKSRTRRRLRQRAWLGREPTDREVGRRARTPQLCSCLGCGNCRGWLGPTCQELRFDLNAREAVADA